MMQVIHGKTNTEALAQGFLRLLSNYVESKNTYLPQSVIEISFFEDLLIVVASFQSQLPGRGSLESWCDGESNDCCPPLL